MTATVMRRPPAPHLNPVRRLFLGEALQYHKWLWAYFGGEGEYTPITKKRARWIKRGNYWRLAIGTAAGIVATLLLVAGISWGLSTAEQSTPWIAENMGMLLVLITLGFYAGFPNLVAGFAQGCIELCAPKTVPITGLDPMQAIVTDYEMKVITEMAARSPTVKAFVDEARGQGRELYEAEYRHTVHRFQDLYNAVHNDIMGVRNVAEY